MPNHKSPKKRMRSDETKRLRNRYQHKTCRTMIKKYKNTTDLEKAKDQLPKLFSSIDKLAKNNIIHKNKAGNLKSKLTKYINKQATST